jgi:hypothetical protein
MIKPLYTRYRKSPWGTLIGIDWNDFSVTRSNYITFQKHLVPERLADYSQHIDKLLMNSVQKLWGKDIEYRYAHSHTTLLRGLSKQIRIRPQSVHVHIPQYYKLDFIDGLKNKNHPFLWVLR